MPIFRRTQRRIEDLDLKVSRDNLLQRSRILVVDDELPELIEDLKQAGFAVDYQPDITTANIGEVERIKYDLIILDFANVGLAFGEDQGLALLKHIKRVNLTAVIFAYTSKSLSTEHADFFRMADGVLRKDAGITESMEKIEDGLQRARSIPNLWKGMLIAANIPSGSKEDLEWQDLYVRGLTKESKMKTLREKVHCVLGSDAGPQVALTILEKLIETGLKVVTGV